MAIDIVEIIQQKLGFPALQKIDPNTQEVKKPENVSPQDYLGQAAIPAVLTGLFKYSRTEAGNAEIISGALTGNLIEEIFGDTKEQAVEKVASFTGNSAEYAAGKMELIARAAIEAIRENLSKEPSGASVKDFFAAQRHNILVYLPASLQMGDVLNDDTLDDRTNKMEGPVSGFMQTIGQIFSKSGNEEKDKNEA